MKNARTGLALAVREHLAEGNPITNLEALTLFGVAWLTRIISDLRREGWMDCQVQNGTLSSGFGEGSRAPLYAITADWFTP